MARLKGAYIVKVEDFTLNEDGSVKEVFASYIPESKSGSDTSGINVKGTMHWVSIPHAKTAEVRLFDRLLIVENAGDLGDDFIKFINPESLQTLEKVYIEPALANVEVGKGLQFIRKGYFCKDSDSTENQLIFNRTVTLKDTWAKTQNK